MKALGAAPPGRPPPAPPVQASVKYSSHLFKTGFGKEPWQSNHEGRPSHAGFCQRCHGFFRDFVLKMCGCGGPALRGEAAGVYQRSIGLLVLCVLAVLQGLFLLFLPRDSRASFQPQWVETGSNIGGVQATSLEGSQTSLVTGTPLLLLVFHPDCGHCREVVPLWREWAGRPDHRIRIIAATADSLARGIDYLASFGWRPEVWSFQEDSRELPGPSITGRTPWIYLIDGAGVVLSDGHGRRIEEITREWTDLIQIRGPVH